MILTPADTSKLREALAACKTGGIESFMLTAGLVRGTNAKRNMAILSPIELSLSPDVKLGVGRLAELEKRLAMFEQPTIELKLNAKNEVAQLSLSSGRTKAQFRCTAESMIKYPKSNDDQPLAVITLSRVEVAQLTKAVRTYGSEAVLVKIGREGAVHLECSDSTNDQFSMDAEKTAEFIEDAESNVFTYPATNFCGAADAVAKDSDEVQLVFGQIGSITVAVRGYTLLIMPIVNEE